MNEYVITVNDDASFDTVLLVIILGMMLDRALAVIFENRVFLATGYARHRALLTLVSAIALAWIYRIDLFSMIAEGVFSSNVPGIVLTGAFMAGASTASTRIISDLLQVRSRAQDMFAAQRQLDATKRATTG